MRTICIALLLSSFASPLSAADKETRQMMADIRMLQEQAQLLQNTLGSLTDVLAAVNKRLDEQAEVNRKAFADQKLTIDTLGRDVGVVREKMDDTIVRVGSLGQEVEALRQSVDAINAPISFSGVPAETASADSPAAADGTAPTVPAASPSAAVGVSPSRLFNEARSDYFLGRYDLAIAGFDAYIKSFPNSDEADDAQLLIGNSYSQGAKYDKAIEAYDLAIRTYPKGNVIPEAYYKKGVAHQSLRQTDRAREAYEYVVKNHPESAAATLAQQGLQALQRQ
jgi:tol-pal system protein YbgF